MIFALVIRLALALALAGHASCPADTYLNGVRPDGAYTCRSKPAPYMAPKRHGILVADVATETYGRVHCRAGELAYAPDFRTVGCRGGQ